MKRLFLIDGHSLIFRMYYAFLRRPMINSKGVDTSILFGFTKYLLELIQKESPSHIGVAFDPPGKTFRHETFAEYKATRSATPELVKSSLNPLIEIMKSLNIPVLMIPGYEADDVIGSAAKKGEKDGYEVYMVSPDKDFGQLISDHIFQFKPGKSGAENEVIGKKEICDTFNITNPLQVIDILAIWGDNADNVPGVNGVGKVGSTKLISKYGTVENILEHLDELSPKQAAAFTQAKSHLGLSKFLVTIKTDIELDFTDEDLRLKPANVPLCKELFTEYEMTSLLKLIQTSSPIESTSEDKDSQAKIKHTQCNYLELERKAKTKGQVGIKIKENTLYLSSDDSIYMTSDFSQAKELLEDVNIKKIGYGIKSYINPLRHHNIHLSGYLADIELLHYLIDPERTHRLDILTTSYLGINLDSYINRTAEEIAEPIELDLFSSQLITEQATPQHQEDLRAIAETLILEQLYKKISEDILQEKTLSTLYDTIEMPLIEVLADMEYEGFKIDTQMLTDFKMELTSIAERLEKEIRELADEPELNISSPRQLGTVLFEKLNLEPKIKKGTRKSYPTDEETLLSIRDKSPIVDKIMEFRTLRKLISTYIEPFPTLINNKTGKIHTTFNQALTATGRLSSAKPNLQNIPIRTDIGRGIRKAFIPSTNDGYIVSSDYSQIELRLMAVMSGDTELVDAFKQGKDIHTATAAKVFNVKEEEVTSEQRRKAKMVNFGIIYGISPFGLAQRLHISRKEAKEIIDEYFKNYPQVRRYMEQVKENASKEGYVETIYHRKRYLPDINSKNVVVRSLAERNAINAPIQGSAADIIKMAMINVYKRIKSEGLKSRMILQVHDELVIDTAPEEREIITRLVKEEMERVVSLDIPLLSECNFGRNWLEAH